MATVGLCFSLPVVFLLAGILVSENCALQVNISSCQCPDDSCAQCKSINGSSTETVISGIHPIVIKGVNSSIQPDLTQAVDSSTQTIITPEVNSSTQLVITPEVNSSTQLVITPEVNSSTQPVFTQEVNSSTQQIFTQEVNSSTQPVFTQEVNSSTQPVFNQEVNSSTQPVFIQEVNFSTQPVFNHEVNSSTQPVFNQEVNSSTQQIFTQEVNSSTQPVFTQEVNSSTQLVFNQEVNTSTQLIITREVTSSIQPAVTSELKSSPHPVVTKLTTTSRQQAAQTQVLSTNTKLVTVPQGTNSYLLGVDTRAPLLTTMNLHSTLSPHPAVYVTLKVQEGNVRPPTSGTVTASFQFAMGMVASNSSSTQKPLRVNSARPTASTKGATFFDLLDRTTVVSPVQALTTKAAREHPVTISLNEFINSWAILETSTFSSPATLRGILSPETSTRKEFSVYEEIANETANPVSQRATSPGFVTTPEVSSKITFEAEVPKTTTLFEKKEGSARANVVLPDDTKNLTGGATPHLGPVDSHIRLATNGPTEDGSSTAAIGASGGAKSTNFTAAFPGWLPKDETSTTILTHKVDGHHFPLLDKPPSPIVQVVLLAAPSVVAVLCLFGLLCVVYRVGAPIYKRHRRRRAAQARYKKEVKAMKEELSKTFEANETQQPQPIRKKGAKHPHYIPRNQHANKGHHHTKDTSNENSNENANRPSKSNKKQTYIKIADEN